MVLLYLALIYYFICTSIPGRRSPKIWHTKIHASLYKCFKQTHMSIYPVKRHIMRIRCYFDATKLKNKHFAVFLKTIHTKEVIQRNLCQEENGDVSRRGGTLISYLILFSISIEVISTRFANWNQQNVTIMFQEHLYILGMVDLATGIW